MALKQLVKQISSSNIHNTTAYPLSSGQKFFTSDTNILYEDILIDGNIYRTAILSNLKMMVGSGTPPSDTSFTNQFVMWNESGSYSLYYYNSNGEPTLISGSGGGGWTPPAATTQYNLMVADGANWISTNQVLKIANALDGGDTYIEFLNGSGDPTYEVKINGKTEITDLDFGGW